MACASQVMDDVKTPLRSMVLHLVPTHKVDGSHLNNPTISTLATIHEPIFERLPSQVRTTTDKQIPKNESPMQTDKLPETNPRPLQDYQKQVPIANRTDATVDKKRDQTPSPVHTEHKRLHHEYERTPPIAKVP